MLQMNRRSALFTSGALPFGLQAARKPLPVAAIVTEYRNNSHADVIVGKILEGWRQDGGPQSNLQGTVFKAEADHVSAL
jgi:hypothetical protein